MENAITFKPLTSVQMSKNNATLEKSLLTAFDARNIQSCADVIFLVNSKQKINDLTDLSMCRVFLDCKTKNLWLEDNDTKVMKIKSFESWAKYHFGIEKSSIENYLFLGRFTTPDGKRDTLPRANTLTEEEKEKSYSYSVLLEIVRGAGKRMPNGKREEKEKEREKRLKWLAENGYITPMISSKKEAQLAVEKGLTILLGEEIPQKQEPTQEPTKEPTQEPTKEPTKEPTQEPTQETTPAQMARYALNEYMKAYTAFKKEYAITEEIERQVKESIHLLDGIFDNLSK